MRARGAIAAALRAATRVVEDAWKKIDEVNTRID
jgi:hypothetical protein